MSTPAQAPTHYEVLGVDPEASIEAIKAAHRRIMRSNHPDLVGEAGAEACAQANIALSVLADARARADYDRSLVTTAPEPVEEVPEWGTQADWESAAATSPTGRTEPPHAPTSPRPDLPDLTAEGSSPRVARPIDSWPVLAAGAVSTLAAVLVLTFFASPISLLGLPADKATFVVLAGLLAGAAAGFRLATSGVSVRILPQVLVFAAVLVGGLVVPFLVTVCSGAFATGLYFTWATRGLMLLQRACDTVITADGLARHNIFGTSVTSRHERVEDVLGELGGVPGVRVFRIPAADHGLTHVVTCGRRLLLVGMLSIPAERYRWTRQGLMVGTRMVLPNTWSAVAKAVTRHTSRAASTSTLFLVTGHGMQVSVDNPRRGVHIAGPEQGTSIASDFLLRSGGNLVDQLLSTQLASALYG